MRENVAGFLTIQKQFSNLSPEEFKRIEKGDTGSNDTSIQNASAAILVFRNSDSEYRESEVESKNLNIKEEQGVALLPPTP